MSRRYVWTQVALLVAVFLVGMKTSGAQGIPPALTGPDSANNPTYAYLSFVLPRPPSPVSGSISYKFRYEFCNRQSAPLAFSWIEPGYGMGLNGPLTPGFCATYELQGDEPQQSGTTIKLSAGDRSAEAYLPKSLSKQPITTTTFGFIPNGPSGINRPVQVTLISRSLENNTFKEFHIEWAGLTAPFILALPELKQDYETLLKNVKTSGADVKFQFTTFSSFVELPLLERYLGIPEQKLIVADIAPSLDQPSGSSTITFGKLDVGRLAIVIIRDRDGRLMQAFKAPIAQQ